MSYSVSGTCRFDAETIATRLRLLDLHESDARATSGILHRQVISPNADKIVDQFCSFLVQIAEFNDIVAEHSELQRLQKTFKRYLLTLGKDFQHRRYFEERLRIGQVHHNLGVPQSLYQCALRHLQELLIEHIPCQIRDDEAEFESLLGFVLKITALDMSLAVESYCDSRVSGLKQSLQSERGETERLRKLSVTDWLTDLHNHSYSRRSLDAALERAKTEASPLCVIMADLDHFKDINDAYGHLVGDEVLRIAAGRMVSGARSGDVICRYGGEEFLFILQSTDIAAGKEVAERVRARINGDAMHSGDTRIMVSMSLGIAEARDGDSVDDLIERADSALYAAKASGRNCVRSGVSERMAMPIL